MTSHQLNDIRAMLVAELSHLDQSGSDDTIEVQYCADVNELASRVSEMNLNVDMRARQLHRLEEIQGAIRRLDSMSYGICDECGDQIAYARLRANPVTRLCISCQEELERNMYSRTG